MFTGKTKNLGVIGWPIAHSLSPVLQNAALGQAGLDYAYIALPVRPEGLTAALEGIRVMGFRGVNVTIPHKSAILPLLDEVDEDARIIGAVNTVVNDDGFLRGYNTDVIGFMDALKGRGFDAAGKRVCVLGAGGAARAVLWALIKEKAACISLGVRNPSKARALVEFFRKYVVIEAMHWEDEAFSDALGTADLLVNTTPLGMHPKVGEMPPIGIKCLKETAFVYDVIYTPAETRLPSAANTITCSAIFRLWTGVEADVELMKKVLEEYLGGKS